MKVCSKCDQLKELQSKAWAKANPDSRRSTRLKFNYGIDLSKYEELFDLQGGCCKICQKHRSVFSSNLSVDHDHKTGKVRGLLCNPCNQAMGLLKEDYMAIKRAA